MTYDSSAVPDLASRWSELAPAGSAAQSTTVAGVAAPDGGLSAFWIGSEGEVVSARHDATMPERGWGPLEEIAPAGTALSPSLRAVSRPSGAVALFWATPAGSLAAKYREPMRGWSQTIALPATESVRVTTTISAVIDTTPGSNRDTIHLFWIPLSSEGARVIQVEPQAPSLGPLRWTEIGRDERPDFLIRAVSAIVGKDNTYVFMLGVDNSLVMACQPRCENLSILADQNEISAPNIAPVAVHGEPGRAAIFHTAANGTIRAADFVGP